MPLTSQNRLDTLYRMSQVLAAPGDLTSALEKTLALLGENLGFGRGAISLLNRLTGRIQVEAAHGLSREEFKRGVYDLGEGITGRVVATGRPMAVPEVSEEPLFLDRTGAGGRAVGDFAFVCVPIMFNEEAIGALWADLPARTEGSLRAEVDFLGLVAGLIAQSVAQLEADRLDQENQRLKSQLGARRSTANLIGNSAAMHEVFTLIDKVAKSKATVLLRGESGTGKGLCASAIHFASPRADRPFINVNCAALPENLVESELFGHEKGAFTGALKAKPGKFELAGGGTVFLDEIGSLPLGAQGKLLRILQDRELERVGGTKTVSVDVRVIAATNRNLEAALAEGEFREDLYYRLNVFPILMPPLRDRRADILLLVDHFIDRSAAEQGLDVRRVAPDAIEKLLNYSWPGNVRELENCIERAVLLTDDRTIRAAHLPPHLAAAPPQLEPTSLPEAVAKLESDLIRSSLGRTKGNLTKAAAELGLTQRQIGYKVKKYDIDPADFNG